MLEQVSVIALHNFNNECTEADAFLTLTTAVIFLSIISNLSIMSSSVVCIFAFLYVYITNNEYSNQSVTIKLYLNKTDTFLLESLSCIT